MAVTRITNSGFTSAFTKYDDMLAGYPPKMAAPTATDGGTGTTVSVAFTAVSGATGYRVISSPGSITATGTSSPITVSGLTAGTAYTFEIQAQNSVGYGAYSAASNSVTPVVPAYSLSQTFNSSGTYTVPSGVTKLAVIISGGGGNGGNATNGGGGSTSGGGNGGAGSYFGGWYDYAVTPGQTYTVTVGGGGGGASAFGNLINSVSPNGFTTNVNTNLQTSAGGNGGSRGFGLANNSGTVMNGNPGSAGGSSSAITAFSNVAGLPANIQYGGGGGGGGAGGRLVNNTYGATTTASGGSAGNGGAPNGGRGGNGNNVTYNVNNGNFSNSISSNVLGGQGPGGGGGGGGGPGWIPAGSNGGYNGAAGAGGIVLVYAK